MSKVNLGNETLNRLHSYGYSINDISWIGSKDMVIPTTNFMSIAFDTNYDNGYGSQEVASNLVVVMKDGSWFDRNEYDGSEWWEFHRCPSRPQQIVCINKLSGIHWPTLESLNEKEE